MPGWSDAIRDANDKEKNDAIQQQIEEWQHQRSHDTGNDRGKYNETDEDDLTTKEGRDNYRKRVRKETDVASDNAKNHATNVQNDIRNEWEARHAGYKVTHIDGVKYYSKGGKTWDEDGRDRTNEM